MLDSRIEPKSLVEETQILATYQQSLLNCCTSMYLLGEILKCSTRTSSLLLGEKSKFDGNKAAKNIKMDITMKRIT